jgi:hypothetical protein
MTVTEGELLQDLKELRILAGVSQRQLADLCPGINSTRICLAEAGLTIRAEEERAIREALLLIIERRIPIVEGSALQMKAILARREPVAV